MKNVLARVNQWENPFLVQTNFSLSEGEVIIIETNEGITPAIVQLEEVEKKSGEKGEKARFLRKANPNDLKIIRENKEREKEFLKICRLEVKKSGLPMKVVDALYSFDRGSITFIFVADGRVDFRELVKSLAKKFKRSIRFRQVGAREESRRRKGGYGICGRELCCIKFKGNLPTITSEMARIQQIVHRGSERISGVCGRLMCCLAYEADQYRELMEEYPQIGTEISYKGQKGIVREINIITGVVGIEREDKNIVFVNKNEL